MLKIRMEVDGMPVTVTLDDNKTSREFVALLPLTLMLEDYASAEKIADLPRKLSSSGAPPGFTPAAGDVAYYAPWGNLAIFHKDFRYSTGLVRLGSIGAGLDAIRRPGRFKTRITLAE